MCITKVTLLLSVFNVGTKIGQFASRQKFLKLKKRSRQLTKIWELVKLCVLKNVGVPWRRRVSHCLFLLCFGALFLRIFWMIATTRNCWKCFFESYKKKTLQCYWQLKKKSDCTIVKCGWRAFIYAVMVSFDRVSSTDSKDKTASTYFRRRLDLEGNGSVNLVYNV